ncbi:chemotaxis protein CheW [Ketobacter alkanivorans]|uniref:CheW-like domain-containing protein n=1 Tax=Ketobacter alkanivorans TaxID=1917421 RepID=A0A2K9LPX7_9GAMM|nr:chemotaxis protein CheW [Ketobacter alkanivorans]AUM14386.1 hypothetical protein Kalk_19000 [Ketobacter alkanivorans]
MNDEKQDDQPINAVDRVIYDYLDEMLHDPAADEPVSSNLPVRRVVPDNVAHFDISKKKYPVASAPVKQPSAMVVDKKESMPYSVMDRPALLSESLLRIAPETPAVKPKEVAPVDTTPESIPEAKVSMPAQKPDPVVEPVEAEIEPDDPQDSALEGVDIKGQNQWCANGRPVWAQSRFECLIFNVNGLKLAVPLITLGSVHQIDRKFNALPGQFDWFLGILQTPSAGNIKVLDTGLCVMPERYDPASRSSLAYVITIHGYSWGLACHQVERSITLEPDQVKWRSQRGKRPWLAGTVVEYMCSLVDTDGFQEIINMAEQTQ